MATEQLLEGASATILQQIHARQPLFLVEIEPSGLSPAMIISQLGRGARWGWKPEYGAAAAWAAVQLASRADAEEVQDEGGFRGLFFRELGREFSLNDWQDTFGYHIRRFLEVTFPSVELPEPGPWHLVGAVYRHAGIPATSKTSYAQFVTKMLRGELSFSFDEYQNNLRLLPSQVVRQFLESRTGYEFTRDLARQVARVYQGGTSSVALPPWSARLVDAVVISLRESDTGSRKLKVPRGFLKPYLCLDAETYSLKILFDSRGVREKYYWAGARPVLYPSQAVRASDSPMFRLGIAGAPEEISPWWTPAEGGWALFRVGDGGLVASGTSEIGASVTAGDYYLVTDNPSAVPDPLVQESQVALDTEGLEDPVWDYSIVRVSLRPGSSIPALAVRVEADLPAPQLEWIRPGRLRTNWGAGIFLEHLPGVRLKPWNSALASEFSLTIEYGDGEIEIAVPSDGEIIGLPSRCPASGYLAIRRGGIAREIIERLSFGVVPTGCHLYAPTDVLRTDEVAQITLDLPSNVAVEWSLPMVKTGQNVYAVPAHERRVEGVLRFEFCSVAFNLRLPRAGVLIQLDGQDQPVLWKEFCDRKYDLRLELPAGAASTLFVSGDETFDELLNQPSHSRAWLQKVPVVHFRDAVLSYPYSVGELILRLRTRDGNLPDINTGHYLASAQNLAKEFMSYPATSPLFAIPILGPMLLKYRCLVERPADKCLPVADRIPVEISAYLARLRFLAKVLDDSIAESHDKRVAADGSGPDTLVDWLREALEHARAGLTDAEVSVPPPCELINLLPVPRWIERITRLISELRQNATLPLLIREFRNSFESGATTSRVSLSQRKGGMDLWHAVNSYRLSLQAPHVSERDQAGQLKRFEAIVSDLETDPVVKFLAQAFRYMNYYRLNRRSMLDTEVFSSWPPMLGPLRATLAALQAREAGKAINTLWPQFGVGLAEISPAAQDSDLESELGRSRPVDAI